jgi:formylglycine-generating enzyme
MLKSISFVSCLIIAGCVPKTPSAVYINDPIINSYIESETTAVEKHCKDGMIEVQGNYCPEVKQTCLRWLDKDQSQSANGGIGPMRCAEFKSPSECLSSSRKYLKFCISKFEYPNIEGSYPLVGINYFEAKALAEKDGNRLCTTEEWNFAGEGEDMHPYPYKNGFTRDCSNTGCNCDKEWRDFTKFPQSSWNAHTDDGLNQSIRSDTNSNCHTNGIYNLAGNVDEILNSEGHKNVILSGGYFGPVRARVRPKTTSHSKSFQFYQIGFRECSDIK